MVARLLPGPFTVEEYYRLGELGILGEDDRVELINGQVVQMTPIGPAHSGGVIFLADRISHLVGTAALVSSQNPLRLGERDEPQPDLALLVRRPGGYRQAHPGPADVLLVIEVADSSLEYDREVKLPLYARAGIPEAWLVNLPADHVELHREPRPEGYASVRIARRGETVQSLVLEGVALSVEEILGPAE
ncbi:MAG TPA: Uma2 family endonuclease [Gemmatimonadales bacterium]|nr:Uma2 family endonuclease [Gemmatimonadales bacterium]